MTPKTKRFRARLTLLMLTALLVGSVVVVPSAFGATFVRVEGVVSHVHWTNADPRNPEKGEEVYLSLDSPIAGSDILRLETVRNTTIRPTRFDDLDELDRRRVTISGRLEQPRVPGGIPVLTAGNISVGGDASLGKGFGLTDRPGRNVPLLTALCRFADETGNQRDQSYFEGLMGADSLAAEFWDELSYGTITLNGSKVVPESGPWYVLPGDVEDYLSIDDPTKMDLKKLFTDCTALAAQDVDLDDFGIVNLFFNFQLVSYSFGGSMGGRRTTWVPYSHWEQAWIPFHELGHAFRGVHSPFQSEYDNAWDLQSGAQLATQPSADFGPVPQHSNVWNKDRAGFVPGTRKRVVPIQGTTTFTLRSATNPVGSGPIMATIEPDAFHSYIIEFRTREGYDAGMPFGAENGVVIIHENFDDPDPEGKKRRAVLMGADGGAGARWLEGDVFKRWELTTPFVPNHNYDIDGFLIRVDEITATSATVTVTRLPRVLLEKGERTKTSYELTWDDASDVETRFEVQYAPVATPEAVSTIIIPGNQTSLVRQGLGAGQSFVHRHRACNHIGCGPWSPDLVYGTRSFDIGS